jgi:hypothetical protein
MADKIKKSDLFEEGLFDDAVKGGERLSKTIDDLQKGIVALMVTTKNKINVINPETYKDIEELNKQIQNSVVLIDQNNKVKKEALELQIKREKAAQEELKTEKLIRKEYEQESKAREKAAQEELKTEKLIRKEYEQESKAREKAAQQAQKQAKANQDLNSEYKKGVKQLSELKQQLKELEFTGRTNGKLYKALGQEFQVLNGKVRDAEEGVGEFQRNVGNYPKQLRDVTKALQGLTPGTAEFERLSKKAGELKDKIGDTKDAIKAFANESKLTTAKTLFGQIGRDLLDLDFKGAADKAKIFSSVVRSITFTEVISGIKNFGSALLNLAKAILLNPFTLLITAVVGLGVALFALKDKIKIIGDTFRFFEGIVTGSIDKLKEFSDWLGITSFKADELHKKTVDNALKQSKALQDRYDREIRYAKAAGKETVSIELKKQQAILETLKIQASEIYLNAIKQRRKLNEEELKQIEEIKQKAIEVYTEINLLKIEEVTKTKEENKKIIESNLERQKKDKEALLEWQKERNEINIEAHEETLKLQEELWKEAMAEADRLSQIEQDRIDRDKIRAEEARKKEQEELKDFQDKTFDLVKDSVSKQSELKQQALDRDITATQKNIDRQRELSDKGLANTLAFEEAKNAQLELRKEQEKQKEVKRQKALAFLKLVSGYAEKDPNNAIPKAIADIAIADLISGSFATGVEALQGEGTETSDSILARLSKNESVITAKATKENAGLPTAMNEGKVDEYFMNKYLPKVAIESGLTQRDTASNINSSLMLNQLMGVNNRLERLEKAIVNKKEQNVEWDKHGNLVIGEVEQGIKRTIKYMKSKPKL